MIKAGLLADRDSQGGDDVGKYSKGSYGGRAVRFLRDRRMRTIQVLSVLCVGALLLLRARPNEESRWGDDSMMTGNVFRVNRVEQVLPDENQVAVKEEEEQLFADTFAQQEENPEEQERSASLKALEEEEETEEESEEELEQVEDEILVEEPVESEEIDQEDVVSVKKDLFKLSERELFANYEELEKCGRIKVNVPVSTPDVKSYVTKYTGQPIYRCVPILKSGLQLTQQFFHKRFRLQGQPVVFTFGSIRSLGFNMEAHTMDQLGELFPYNPNTKVKYIANKYTDTEFLDLGPAVHAFRNDGKLVKRIPNQGASFPRNLRVKPEALAKLQVQIPPLIKRDASKSFFQVPSLWFGTSSSGTAFHADACDNFVLMITGTKRWTLAPPTDWDLLAPTCIGAHKNLCYGNPSDPQFLTAADTDFNRMQLNLTAGEILYLPSATFHHIENLGPTLMTNIWTSRTECRGVKQSS